MRNREVEKLKKENNSKILKIIVPTIAIAAIGVGIWKFPNTQVENIESTWKVEKETKYEIGGKYTNKEIENSIMQGCYLEQYIEGEKIQKIEDSDMTVYGDSTGNSTIYHDENGNIESLYQQIDYDNAEWSNVVEFWEKLDSREIRAIDLNGCYSEEELTSKLNDSEFSLELYGVNGEYEYLICREFIGNEEGEFIDEQDVEYSSESKEESMKKVISITYSKCSTEEENRESEEDGDE